MATDREIIKKKEAGEVNSLVSANNAIASVNDVHRRTLHAYKGGTENADTNVAELGLVVVNRKAIVKSVKYLTGTNVAGNATDYVLVTVAKRTAGGAATTVATYNTHTSAQSSVTQWSPASFSVVTSSDATLAAGDALTYKLEKYGAGKALAVGHFAVDIEEV